jgi:hypothetical protein
MFCALTACAGNTLPLCRNKNRFPTPLDATTQDDVYVGRIRRDISRKDNKGLELFVCGDQIKKGEQEHRGGFHSRAAAAGWRTIRVWLASLALHHHLGMDLATVTCGLKVHAACSRCSVFCSGTCRHVYHYVVGPLIIDHECNWAHA